MTTRHMPMGRSHRRESEMVSWPKVRGKTAEWPEEEKAQSQSANSQINIPSCLPQWFARIEQIFHQFSSEIHNMRGKWDGCATIVPRWRRWVGTKVTATKEKKGVEKKQFWDTRTGRTGTGWEEMKRKMIAYLHHYQKDCKVKKDFQLSLFLIELEKTFSLDCNLIRSLFWIISRSRGPVNLKLDPAA